MNFTVNSKIIVAMRAQAVQLAPILGAFELTFQLLGTIHGKSDDMYRWLTASGARVTLRAKGGTLIDLGIAASEKAFVIRQTDNSHDENFSLKIPLLPYQIELLEAARDGGDLDFTLKFFMRGCTSQSDRDWEEQGDTTLAVHVPESAWIGQLNNSKASRVLLFEVRLPLADGASIRHPADAHLVRAQELFVRGDWRECVGACRQFAEELGGNRLAPALDMLNAGRRAMSKQDREAVLIAALQHYGHSATHSKSKHGELDYNRRDAKLALSVAASLAAFHFTA